MYMYAKLGNCMLVIVSYVWFYARPNAGNRF